MVRSWSRLCSQTAARNASGLFIQTLADHASLRKHLCGHVVAMAPLGFSAHALGRVAERHLEVILGTPDALVNKFKWLRRFFAPWGDELVDDLRRTTIPPACLPAVVQDGLLVVSESDATLAVGCISRLHKAALAGPFVFWAWTKEGLAQHMRTLVAAGLFTTEADARQGCMSRNMLLAACKVEWYVWRKAAVLEAGGTMEHVHLACCRNGHIQAALPGLLLFKRSRSVPVRIAHLCFYRARLYAVSPHLQVGNADSRSLQSSRALDRCCSRRGHATPACTYRGAFGITCAFVSADRQRAMAALSADGVRDSAVPSFDAHLASAEGQTELRSFRERVSTRAEAQIQELAEGVTERSRQTEHAICTQQHAPCVCSLRPLLLQLQWFMCPCSAAQSGAVGRSRAQGGACSGDRPPCRPARRRDDCSIASASAPHARGLPAAHRDAALVQLPAGGCGSAMDPKGSEGK